MTDTAYNGYENYETYSVAFWLSNKRGIYRHWREMAHEAKLDARDWWEVKEGIWPAKDAPKNILAMRLLSEVYKRAPINEPGLNADLLRRALAAVNWHQVADRFLDGLRT